ncbi:MAG: ABC transporter ATP-binding protein [Coriobacteriales bacterium]|jgi:simple sugar transport system ATP-binding protein|nr:ABC transporter ATP-binding protein [Coriobacteriales bacterium]
MSETILELKHISKRFPGVIANNDISLEIQRGEIFAFLGENGAGKSTLASIIFGMYSPDAGEIILRGQAVQINSPARAVELDIGMVHQHFKLVSNYSVTENIILGREPIKRLLGIIPAIDYKKARAQVQELIDRYDFDLSADDLIEDLNVSSQQRVEILKMLYRDAEILIFDEPTAMLTPQEIDSLLAIIRRLREAGKTIILITHKLEEIKLVADRCAIMSRGHLIDVYDVQTTSTQLMANRMVGRQLSFQLDKAPAHFGPAVLELKELSVIDAFKVKRLDKASFTVHAGEVFALAGVAGNGQIQLADALAGLVQHSGQIILNGQDISQASVRKRIQSGLAYIPEDRHGVGLFLDFDVTENLISKQYYRPPFAHWAFLQKKTSQRYAELLIVRYDVRCAQGPATIVRSMSGGNQQKLIIARELDTHADLVIFVQPTRGLDIGATLSIRQRIIDERNSGKAVLLISLELEEVLTVADNIAVIFNGNLTKVTPAAEISLAELGEYMMGVRQ